jgi:hypothetical protein
VVPTVPALGYRGRALDISRVASEPAFKALQDDPRVRDVLARVALPR